MIALLKALSSKVPRPRFVVFAAFVLFALLFRSVDSWSKASYLLCFALALVLLDSLAAWLDAITKRSRKVTKANKPNRSRDDPQK
jgi:hypothetical protein